MAIRSLVVTCATIATINFEDQQKENKYDEKTRQNMIYLSYIRKPSPHWPQIREK
jgi:hypothetical protein